MYREQILDLYKNPRNFGTLENANRKHRAHNPLCGDDITMQFFVKDGKVEEVKFKGKACAICTASASLVTDALKGKDVESVLKMTKEQLLELLGVEISQVRLKCALLPLEAAHKAIQDDR